jgi:hypothetical protein
VKAEKESENIKKAQLLAEKKYQEELSSKVAQ